MGSDAQRLKQHHLFLEGISVALQQLLYRWIVLRPDFTTANFHCHVEIPYLPSQQCCLVERCRTHGVNRLRLLPDDVVQRFSPVDDAPVLQSRLEIESKLCAVLRRGAPASFK